MRGAVAEAGRGVETGCAQAVHIAYTGRADAIIRRGLAWGAKAVKVSATKKSANGRAARGRRMTNHLYYGDNLKVLRDSVEPESVDLIYLDPPFNSNASYNVLFKGPQGNESAAQIEAFDDTWHWNDSAEAAFQDVLRSGNGAAAEMLRAMRGFLGENDMMAYLAMMAVRLIELHRVLKPTGSLYLHCDPTASHYLKILLDAVFGATNFRNEIVWKTAHTVKAKLGQGAKYFRPEHRHYSVLREMRTKAYSILSSESMPRST